MDFFNLNKSHTRDIYILPFTKAERVEGGKELRTQFKMAAVIKYFIRYWVDLITVGGQVENSCPNPGGRGHEAGWEFRHELGKERKTKLHWPAGRPYNPHPGSRS